MVGTDGIADIRLLFVFLCNLRTVDSVRILGILIGHLTYIVQQSGALGLLRIQTELGSHHGTEVGRFTGVLQQVLAVAGTILHLTHDTNQLGMQTVDTQVDGRALTRLDNLIIKLLLHLGHHFLDAGGVDATVAHQLVQGQAANLTTHGIEGRDDDGLGRVVDDDFHAAGSLQCTDVTTLTANDAALDVVVVDVEHRHAILDSRLGSHALNRLDDNLLSLRIGIELGLVDNLVDIAGSIGAGLVLQALHQTGLGLFSTQTGEFLQLLALLTLHLLQFLLLDGKEFLLVVHALLVLLDLLLAAAQLFLALVERNLTLLQLVLTLLDALVALLNFLFEFTLLVQELLLHFQQFLFLNHFSLLVGGCNHFLILPRYDITEKSVADESTQDKGDGGCNQYCNHY